MILQNKKTGKKYRIDNILYAKLKSKNKHTMFNIIDYSDFVDVIDLACGSGGSLGWAKSVFGWDSYLGIDVDNSFVGQAKDFGYRNIIQGDLLTMDFSKLPKARYVIMHHFLEHLQNDQEVELMINKAIGLAKEFVFIKHPFFDGDEYLKDKGFKLTWSDWEFAHSCHVNKAMLENILNKTGLEYKIGFVNPIKNSDFGLIIPFNAPHEQCFYKPEHGIKEFTEFENVFHETYAFININCPTWDELIKKDIR